MKNVRAVLTLAALAAASLVPSGPASAAPSKLPPQIWAIQVPAKGAGVTSRYLKGVRATGVNAIVVDATTPSATKIAQTRAVAASTGGLQVLVAYAAGARCPALRAPALCAT